MKRTQTHKRSRRARLTNKQAAAIPLLVGGATDTDVASALGVRRETVSRWRAAPHFKEELDAAQARAFGDALDELRVGSVHAVRVLKKSLASEDENIQLRAANSMLRFLIPAPHALTVTAELRNEPRESVISIEEAETRIENAKRALESAKRAGGLTKPAPGLREPRIGKKVSGL